ncbi:hypothetical protein F2Q69_00007216 [Brassica cretica]|uniref:Uncharacterized protein n=1 Tax=Brassica cretica TaxID=69181 RepID=A0A8S9NWQ2_BRACR|nr:hypothetical protein F2Q69_00007216 [Brassica cretica]
MSRFKDVEKFVKLGTATSGNSYQHFLRSGSNDTKPDRATIISFKVIPLVLLILRFNGLNLNLSSMFLIVVNRFMFIQKYNT